MSYFHIESQLIISAVNLSVKTLSEIYLCKDKTKHLFDSTRRSQPRTSQHKIYAMIIEERLRHKIEARYYQTHKQDLGKTEAQWITFIYLNYALEKEISKREGRGGSFCIFSLFKSGI